MYGSLGDSDYGSGESYHNNSGKKFAYAYKREELKEKEAFNQARENVDYAYPKAFELAKLVVNRAYPSEDVATCRTLKQKYGTPLDVVAKDKCFYFSYAKENPGEDEDKEVSEHFDFGLFGSLSNSSYSDGETGKQFAYAYKREELKAKDCNPDILAQQNGKDENPYKTKHIDANNKALGYSNYSSYNSDRDNNE